jgi:hypothetical protein
LEQINLSFNVVKSIGGFLFQEIRFIVLLNWEYLSCHNISDGRQAMPALPCLGVDLRDVKERKVFLKAVTL